MSRSYAFHQPPEDLSRSLLRQVRSSSAELHLEPHPSLAPGEHPASQPAVERALRRRRWPGRRISSFVAALRRPSDLAPKRPGPGLRRTLTRAMRRQAHQELTEHYVEELD